MIDQQQDGDRLLVLREVAERLPSCRAGKATHVSRVVRMIVEGVRLPDGTRERLKASRFGKQWLVRESEIAAFGERVAAASIRASEAAPRPRPATRTKQAASASRELDRLGI
jgi:hypothetical protein